MSIFKISLPGTDVKNARIQDLVLSSLYPNPKIDTTASPPHAGIIFLNWQAVGLSQANNTTKLIYSFSHGYDYIPTAFAAYKFDNGSLVTDGVLPFQYGNLGEITIDTDPTNVNIKYQSIDLASTTVIPPFLMQIRFYVMADRGKA